MKEYRVTLDKSGLNRDFVFIGGPLDANDGSPELYTAIGTVSAQWARLEQHIDAVLLHINNPDHSREIFDPKHPASFSRKIFLIKRWFNQHPALSQMTDDMRTLTSKLKEINTHRQNLIHGVLEQWDTEKQSAVFRTLKYIGDDEFVLSTHTYTMEAIRDVADIVSSSNRFLANISRTIFTLDALERLRKP